MNKIQAQENMLDEVTGLAASKGKEPLIAPVVGVLNRGFMIDNIGIAFTRGYLTPSKINDLTNKK